MSKLLTAEFIRLLKSRVFKLCLLFSAGLGIFAVLMRWKDVKQDPDLYDRLGAAYSTADGLMFIGGMYLTFAAAVLIGIFVGTEYSDGTIRNKLTAGHTRGSIYFSKLITCSAASTAVYILSILTILVFGNMILGVTMPATEILAFTAAGTTATLAFAAFLLLCSMSIQSKALSAVTCLLTTLVMFFAAMTIDNRLNQPEYYEPYEITAGETGETIQVPKEKNPHYLTGTKRKIYEFLNDFFPVSQLAQIAQQVPDRLHVIAIYDGVIFLAASGAGIFLFRKKNLN